MILNIQQISEQKLNIETFKIKILKNSQYQSNQYMNLNDSRLDQDHFTADFDLRLGCLLTMLIPIIIFPTVGKNTKAVSDKYWLRVTPPAVFFGIWGVIYILADSAAIYSFANNLWSPFSWIFFATSNVSVGIWTLIYTQGTITAINISILFEVILAISNEYLWSELVQNPKLDNFMGIIIKNCFAFGQGWFIAATFLGIGATLVYYYGMNLNTQLLVFWATVPLAYEFNIWHNCTISSFQNTVGLLVTAIYAVTGAGIASLKPWPKELKND